MKLSLTAIAGEIEHLADNAYTPNESWVIALKINLRAIAATLRDGDEHYCACPTPGAEPGHRCLNCELWVAALAKQAQPLTDEQIRRKAHDWNPDASHAYSEGAKWARDRMAQQAQPEMPTREKFENELHERNAGHAGRDWVISIGSALEAFDALFAPKETLAVCDFCGGEPMTDDAWHKHMETDHNAPPRPAPKETT